jgi:hypothetical protein
VKERWKEHLDDKINKIEWDTEEDMSLLSHVSMIDKRWKDIAKMRQGRTGGQCKNRFN